MGSIAWKSWINDPIYTLDAFGRSSKMNLAKWENQEFQLLLDLAHQEVERTKRLEYLKQAEQILALESPLIPIFYEVYHYMQKKYLHHALHSDVGGVDFKWARIQHASNALHN